MPDLVQSPDECEQAFAQVKAVLVGCLLLCSSDFSPYFALPFVLKTGMSDRGLGKTLSQVLEGMCHAVHQLQTAMYSIIEKECLAIKWVVLTL